MFNHFALLLVFFSSVMSWFLHASNSCALFLLFLHSHIFEMICSNTLFLVDMWSLTHGPQCMKITSVVALTGATAKEKSMWRMGLRCKWRWGFQQWNARNILDCVVNHILHSSLKVLQARVCCICMRIAFQQASEKKMEVFSYDLSTDAYTVVFPYNNISIHLDKDFLALYKECTPVTIFQSSYASNKSHYTVR